ncbi:uncharacterized protein LOC135499253 [Lineus longissimus]|uniref:uncharacterized protein LOC135499253 n=1 Tax=Lineus longissimus TaxID=88925 RepID=UPI002B4ECA7A
MLWIIFGASIGIAFGPSVAWDYTDDIGREWDTQDPRLLPEISVPKYLEKCKLLIGASSGYQTDYQTLARYSRFGGLTIDMAMGINRNMTSYCDAVIEDTENDFNAAYGAFTSSEKVFQATRNELTEAEKAEMDELRKLEGNGERRKRLVYAHNRREDSNSPEFEYEDLRSADTDNGYGYYYGSGDEATDGPTEAPREYDRRLWPTLYREETFRNTNYKNSVDQLRDFLAKAYELKKIFADSEIEMKENMTINNLIQGTQALEQFLTAADIRALYAYIGIHHFSTFSEPWAVYPEERKDTLYSLKYKLTQSTIMARTLDTGSFFPVKYWQDYAIIDKPDFNCSSGELSVVDCPLSYLKKYGVTAIDIKKFDPWLKTFNKARRIRVNEISVRLGGARVKGAENNTTTTNEEVTMEVFNVGECRDYFLFEEHIFLGAPVHLKYIYNQENYDKRLLQPINPTEEVYHVQTTPFTKWLIVFDKVLNPDLDLSAVNDLRISWSGEVSLNPYP